MQTRKEGRGNKQGEGQTEKDLPKHWKDAQNHFLHGNKSLHLVNLAAAESRHGESEKREKTERKSSKQTLYYM